MKNKYIIRSRISEKAFRAILKLFCIDIEASKTAEITDVSRPAINRIFAGIRARIAHDCERISPFEHGSVELDESYFGPKRVRGRGAGKKVPVFGMLQRGGKVYTQVVKNCSRAEIMPIIKQKASRDVVIYSDGFKTYDGLVDFGYKRHYRVTHSANEFANGHNHINGIENFWGLCKVRLGCFRGIHEHMFYYHLKECEFRFNMRHENIYQYLLKLIRNNPLKVS
ncbi:IS1595 family transposase [Candidatus Spongiihabitans sp.]|uniref:IS1595 family transposase n=1 Tax=Candidatus Spongiihabitans sp. TaxID=3101308 RepID=UPI003C704853